jgi:long-chain acyl-CoA synthetase
MHYALKNDLEKDDSYLSYLPLYSRLEYSLTNVFLISGVMLGFGTELDTFLLSAPYNQKCCPASYGDIQSFSPSILFGLVPWWEVIHGELLKAVAARPIQDQNDFWKWLERKRNIVGGRASPLVNMFEKWGHIAEIRASFFGERVKWVGVACSMMTPEKRELLGLVFGGVKGIMVQGWGLLHMSS